jgi:sirohydrochlorin cobaltochelatase
MSETAVLICGHGSRDIEAVREFELLATALRPRFPDYDFATGYLEFARPTIRDGLTALAARGAKRIYAVPGMLFAASHVKNDLPWEMNSFLADNPGIDVRLGRDLGIEARLINAAADRIAGAAPGDSRPDFSDTLLVTVGRGTNDPDANSNIAKISRMLWEGLGFGWAEVAFSGVAQPRVDMALDRAARLGFRRIVVFPYFLFTGVLVKRIYDQTDAAALRFPEIEFVKAPYLRDHPLLLDAFVERVGEIAEGSPAMNCQLCKYRAQIVGYEAEVGAPQQGHHHHVRGIGTDADHHHHAHDGHHHDHDHPHR